jgi:hypothetical protein
MNTPNKFCRLASEPPFRHLSKAVLKLLRVRASTRAHWDISRRPQYLVGLVAAAHQAKLQGISAISAIEFGVAGGYGLLAMQSEAEAVSRETGVDIQVIGMDLGSGLPSLLSDYRDFPDIWAPGDYVMDEAALRSRLRHPTLLILGDVRETVPELYVKYAIAPVGFVAIDVDLYSSTKAVLSLFTAPKKRILRHVAMYVDDIDMFWTHRRGGELLAIDEFNAETTGVFIDRWRGLRSFRPFPEAPYLDRMFIAHDLEAISAVRLSRDRRELPLARP